MSAFVNKFQVVAYGDIVRVICTDCVAGQEGAIQANLVMRTHDAQDLALTIGQAVAKQRETK